MRNPSFFALAVLLTGTNPTHAQSLPATLPAPDALAPSAPVAVLGLPIPSDPPVMPPATPPATLPPVLQGTLVAPAVPVLPMPSIAPVPPMLGAPVAPTGPVARQTVFGAPQPAPTTTQRMPAGPPSPPSVPVPTAAAVGSAVPSTGSCAPTVCFCPEAASTNDPWFRADYLLWWVRSGPTGGPLVTTSAPADGGVLGGPSTRVLFGDSPMNYGTFSGMRLSAGLPLGTSLSLEGGYFVLEQRAANFTTASNAAGSPLIARPVIDAQTGAECLYRFLPRFPRRQRGGGIAHPSARL